MLKYGNLTLEAEIIGVHDDSSKLRELEVLFLYDPSNAQLFTGPDPEPEPRLTKRKRSPDKNSIKKGKKDAAPKRKRKEPEMATVLCVHPPPQANPALQPPVDMPVHELPSAIINMQVYSPVPSMASEAESPIPPLSSPV
ncbi:uncharacterized protein [Montipora capricornis]|uniref:uncharacterized protein n=1 Tax=Montipora capricornis TaxID=246305 RepID=UPI0035F1E698